MLGIVINMTLQRLLMVSNVTSGTVYIHQVVFLLILLGTECSSDVFKCLKYTQSEFILFGTLVVHVNSHHTQNMKHVAVTGIYWEMPQTMSNSPITV